MRLERGATIAIDSSFAASASVAPRLTVLGAEATCEIVADARVVLRRGDGTSEDLTPKPLPGDDGRTDRHAEPMHRFAEVVRDVVTSAEYMAQTMSERAHAVMATWHLVDRSVWTLLD